MKEALAFAVTLGVVVVGMIFGVGYVFEKLEGEFGGSGAIAMLMSILVIAAVFIQQFISNKSLKVTLENVSDMMQSDAKTDRYREQTRKVHAQQELAEMRARLTAEAQMRKGIAAEIKAIGGPTEAEFVVVEEEGDGGGFY